MKKAKVMVVDRGDAIRVDIDGHPPEFYYLDIVESDKELRAESLAEWIASLLAKAQEA